MVLDAEIVIGVALVLICSLYAAWLSYTQIGLYLAEHHTWATVVLGVSIVLAVVWLVYPAEAARWFWYFAAAGTPMILRSLMLFASVKHKDE